MVHSTIDSMKQDTLLPDQLFLPSMRYVKVNSRYHGSMVAMNVMRLSSYRSPCLTTLNSNLQKTIEKSLSLEVLDVRFPPAFENLELQLQLLSCH